MSHRRGQKSAHSDSLGTCKWACLAVWAVVTEPAPPAVMEPTGATVMEPTGAAVLALAPAAGSERVVLAELAREAAMELAAPDPVNPLRVVEEAGEQAPPPGSGRTRCRSRRGALSVQSAVDWRKRLPESWHLHYQPLG
jgi:hypothetical protein